MSTADLAKSTITVDLLDILYPDFEAMGLFGVKTPVERYETLFDMVLEPRVREQMPLYIMGRSNPVQYSRGKRKYGGDANTYVTCETWKMVSVVGKIYKKKSERWWEPDFE
jgi:hypothetical protein